MKIRLILILMALCVTGCDSIKTAMKGILEKPGEADSDAMQTLIAVEYHEFTEQTGILVVVYFHADWCPQCKRLAPVLNKLAVEYRDQMVVGKLDVDEFAPMATKQGVHGIPEVRLYRNGEEVDKLVGLTPEKDLRSRLEQYMEAPVQTRVEKGPEKQAMAGNNGMEEQEPEKPREPALQPMTKDWLPPGMERK